MSSSCHAIGAPPSSHPHRSSGRLATAAAGRTTAVVPPRLPRPAPRPPLQPRHLLIRRCCWSSASEAPRSRCYLPTSRPAGRPPALCRTGYYVVVLEARLSTTAPRLRSIHVIHVHPGAAAPRRHLRASPMENVDYYGCEFLTRRQRGEDIHPVLFKSLMLLRQDIVIDNTLWLSWAELFFFISLSLPHQKCRSRTHSFGLLAMPRESRLTVDPTVSIRFVGPSKRGATVLA
ncbi:LOW QUALITY PROTEIN: hypothetical protein Syun_005056 [Stephania yunnanensis]|uniref:Uncharacterized protein n=1 Tax=Stephania yunnanensis TaxID=152371 RepID=A0AAP0Q337_9MAGN